LFTLAISSAYYLQKRKREKLQVLALAPCTFQYKEKMKYFYANLLLNLPCFYAKSQAI